MSRTSRGAHLRPDGSPHPVYLVRGGDASLVAQALAGVLGDLGHDAARPGEVLLEEHGRPGRDEQLAIGPVLDALSTPPFLAQRRVVVLRDAESLDAAQAKQLATYLIEPLETSVLVLASVAKALPAALSKAVRERGLVVDSEPEGGARGRSDWLGHRLREGPVRLDGPAQALLGAHLGEDLGRLDGILSTLAAAYGTGASVDSAALEPFLGSEGGVAPWDLTDAIDAGELADATAVLHRMLGPGARHPLQVLASLYRHFAAMLRLDGVEGIDRAGAAALTGMSPFPAQKALAQSRALGHDRIASAIRLLAAADLDLRGRSGWPGDLVLEVLVARLARLARRSGRARAGATR